MNVLSRPIALVGISGAGKSAVAARLAARLGGDAADLDARIEAEAGHTIAELFAERGEAAFRALETRVLAAAMAAGARVIACGGGAPTAEASRALLRAGCRVVWLEVTPAEAARRLGPGHETRPLLQGGDPEGRLAELLRQRSEHYRSLAILRVPTDGRDPDQVADAIARGLAAEPPA
jgi:shikimate kinase